MPDEEQLRARIGNTVLVTCPGCGEWIRASAVLHSTCGWVDDTNPEDDPDYDPT